MELRLSRGIPPEDRSLGSCPGFQLALWISVMSSFPHNDASKFLGINLLIYIPYWAVPPIKP